MSASATQVQKVCEAIINIVPDGTGFIVFTFPLGDGKSEPIGDLRYTSNANRSDCINVLKEWMIKCGHHEDWMKNL